MARHRKGRCFCPLQNNHDQRGSSSPLSCSLSTLKINSPWSLRLFSGLTKSSWYLLPLIIEDPCIFLLQVFITLWLFRFISFASPFLICANWLVSDKNLLSALWKKNLLNKKLLNITLVTDLEIRHMPWKCLTWNIY